MEDDVEEDDAVDFSYAFYHLLSHGCSFRDSFELVRKSGWYMHDVNHIIPCFFQRR